MKTRALALLIAVALATPATIAFADDEPEPKPPEVVLVDFAAIPTGALPPLPAETDAPMSAPQARVTELKVEPIADKVPTKHARKKHLRGKKKQGARVVPPRAVEVRPAVPALGLLYAPSDDASEVDGDSSQRMVCGNPNGAAPLRWEKLAIDAGGHAELEIQDIWLDSRSCSLWPGSASVINVAPIAWHDGKPWLYAFRGDTSITFVMPRSDEMTAETMVGAPVTIRGAFTRVTMPLGRWGSGTILAALPSFSLDVPTPKNAKKPSAPAEAASGPVELTVELVQTMSEPRPTLLVRTQGAVASNDLPD
jgi:hypothetical protein